MNSKFKGQLIPFWSFDMRILVAVEQFLLKNFDQKLNSWSFCSILIKLLRSPFPSPPEQRPGLSSERSSQRNRKQRWWGWGGEEDEFYSKISFESCFLAVIYCCECHGRDTVLSWLFFFFQFFLVYFCDCARSVCMFNSEEIWSALRIRRSSPDEGQDCNPKSFLIVSGIEFVLSNISANKNHKTYPRFQIDYPQSKISLDVISQLLKGSPQLLHVLGDGVEVHERRLDVSRPLLVVQCIVQDHLLRHWVSPKISGGTLSDCL